MLIARADRRIEPLRERGASRDRAGEHDAGADLKCTGNSASDSSFAAACDRRLAARGPLEPTIARQFDVDHLRSRNRGAR